MDELAAARQRRRRPDDVGTQPDQRTVLEHVWHVRAAIRRWTIATVALAIVAIAVAVLR